MGREYPSPGVRGPQSYPVVRPDPPPGQWVVILDAAHYPLADVSYVDFTLAEVRQRLTTRFGPGRLSRTKHAGLLRWEQAASPKGNTCDS